jgi:hypothetical protein
MWGHNEWLQTLWLVQFLAFRLQEVSGERDALATDLRKTKVRAFYAVLVVSCAATALMATCPGRI